ncbi:MULTISPECIES: hypothetical protein [unclassified Pseudomonas]|uniref:hypothetical protein n=1 Tax=unclassified Pseudomonas TaxID=196821 RepID=UPI001CBC281B|nr:MULTISPECIES: hypothetical protein [unclassified Pseudomonas]
MSDVIFVAAIGRDELYIRVANRFDKPFTLDCNLDRRGSPAYLELPRHYQTLRGAKSAAAKLFGGGLEWETPEPVTDAVADRKADTDSNPSLSEVPSLKIEPEVALQTSTLDRACEDFEHFIKYILEPAKDDLEALVSKNEAKLHQVFGANLILAHSVDYLQAVRAADGITETRKELVAAFDAKFSVPGAYLANRKMELVDGINNALKHIRINPARYKGLGERYGQISFQTLMEEEGRILCHLEDYRFDYCRVVLLPALKALSNWEFEGTDDVVRFARGDYIVSASTPYLDIYDPDDPSTAIDQLIELSNPPCVNCDQSHDDCLCAKYVFAGESGRFEPAYAPTAGEIDQLLSHISPSYRRS